MQLRMMSDQNYFNNADFKATINTNKILLTEISFELLGNKFYDISGNTCVGLAKLFESEGNDPLTRCDLDVVLEIPAVDQSPSVFGASNATPYADQDGDANGDGTCLMEEWLDDDGSNAANSAISNGLSTVPNQTHMSPKYTSFPIAPANVYALPEPAALEQALPPPPCRPTSEPSKSDSEARVAFNGRIKRKSHIKYVERKIAPKLEEINQDLARLLKVDQLSDNLEKEIEIEYENMFKESAKAKEKFTKRTEKGSLSKSRAIRNFNLAENGELRMELNSLRKSINDLVHREKFNEAINNAMKAATKVKKKLMPSDMH